MKFAQICEHCPNVWTENESGLISCPSLMAHLCCTTTQQNRKNSTTLGPCSWGTRVASGRASCKFFQLENSGRVFQKFINFDCVPYHVNAWYAFSRLGRKGNASRPKFEKKWVKCIRATL